MGLRPLGGGWQIEKGKADAAKMDDFERAVLIVFNETGAVDTQLKVNGHQRQ